MRDPFPLPVDLSADERAVVDALRDDALRAAEEDAALMILVEREYRTLRQGGHGKDGAFQLVAERLPVSRERARQMVYRLGRWRRTRRAPSEGALGGGAGAGVRD